MPTTPPTRTGEPGTTPLQVDGHWLPAAEPARTLRAAVLGLRSWTVRQYVAAGLFSVAFALLIGYPTVLIPNSVFSREIAVLAWNYPVWIVTSVLAGMLAASYVRPEGRAAGRSRGDGADESAEVVPGDDGAAPSRLGMAGGVLTWFAVGCPVCNKLALLALGYSGAITWFAPVQPYLAAVGLGVTAVALVVRLRGQVLCRLVPRSSRA
ncbi:hypothetical protein [Actinotalea sp. K2]|uniref:hypothetical protein n=1 Tax=Actinotalea sp. K2 TaxID=2939438 RepID=UPI0020172AEF|nr:hypothetical protein [Actinotalea sp. K2]MCL3862277.1 hypothetical protein [Actinotalea sp. K2]